MSYVYNGLGDRLQETLGEQTTIFIMDYNAGLTQALSDGTNTYVYGVDRIAQINSSTQYFLGDALGSVRQLVDANGAITYAGSYDPYGVTTQTYGTAQSTYGYTGEYTDSYIKLIYLRSRWYDPQYGRFLTKDSWMGDSNRPLSLNQWNYVEGNPINYTDPIGLIKQNEANDANNIVKELKAYRIFVDVDWGGQYWYNDPLDPTKFGAGCSWYEGEWSLWELKELRKGTVDLSHAMGGLNKFIDNIGYVNVVKGIPMPPNENAIAVTVPHLMKVNTKYHTKFDRWSTVHELGHAWDANFGYSLSADLVILTAQYGQVHAGAACDVDRKLPGCNTAGYIYTDVLAAGSSDSMNPSEDFANSVAAYVYPYESQAGIRKYDTHHYREYLYYSDYRTTLRWRIIEALINATNQYRP